MAALCAHVGVAAALSRVPALALLASVPQPAREELFVVSEELASASGPVVASAREASDVSRAIAVVPRGSLVASSPSQRAKRGGERDVLAAQDDVPKLPDATEKWSLTRAAPIDLGVGAYWKSVVSDAARGVPERARPTEESPRPEPSPSPDRILRDGLEAHDRAVGLGAGGPLVSAAHDAASPSIAPDLGSATLEVECDARGKVVTAHVVAAAANVAAWSDVARELVRLMSAKSVRLPAGARGLRARVRIAVERTWPSGKKGGVGAGAVPDDAPGTPEGGHVCVGVGAERKCDSGFLVGFTATGADVTNLAAKAMRIVRVQLLGEVAL